VLRWITRLVLLFALGFFAPGEAAARVATRVGSPDVSAQKLASWGSDPEVAVLRQAAALQAAEMQQGSASHGYDFASECLLAAETTAARAGQGIYEFSAASGTTYVGQSGNIATRLEQHIASGKLPPGNAVQTTEVLDGRTAREIAEQLRINQLGGVKNLEKIKNPIGPARQHLLPGGPQ